jgi:hypothetical protein
VCNLESATAVSVAGVADEAMLGPLRDPSHPSEGRERREQSRQADCKKEYDRR